MIQINPLGKGTDILNENIILFCTLVNEAKWEVLILFEWSQTVMIKNMNKFHERWIRYTYDDYSTVINESILRLWQQRQF